MNLEQIKFENFFNPESVAVIGVSTKRKNLGYKIYQNLIESGFKGEIYAVNIKGGTIGGQKVFKTVLETPKNPELVILAIKSEFVNEALETLGRACIKNVIIISAGFSEIGTDGKNLQDQIVKTAREYGINIIGPNCLGVISTKSNLNASFSKGFPLTGNAVFISQSGALCTSVLDWATKNNVGFRDFISIGNKANINENDLLKYYLHLFRNDKSTNISVIALYLEDFANGVEFMNIAKELSRFVPVVILKPGKSDEAQGAIKSHTGALASSDVVVTSALKQAGCIKVEKIEELFKLIMYFSWQPIMKNASIAIVTNAGGPAIITTDRIIEKGMKLAKFDKDARDRLSRCLPREANIHDPVDIIGDALSDRYGEAIDIVLSQKSVGTLVVLLTPQIMTEIDKTAKFISKLSKEHLKPVVCSFIGGSSVDEGMRILTKNKIPVFRFPEIAVDIISFVDEYRRWIKFNSNNSAIEKSTEFTNSKRSTMITRQALEDLRYGLRHDEIDDIADIYKVPMNPRIVVSRLSEAVEAANKIGYPLVVKINSERIIHKTDIGGVYTDVKNEKDLEIAFNGIKNIIGKDMLKHFENIGFVELQKKLHIDYELFLGAKRDSDFGITVVIGYGGIFTEVIRDTTTIVMPCSKDEITKHIEKTKVSKLFKGFRRIKPIDIDSLLSIIYKIYFIIRDNRDIDSIDINPLIVNEGKINIVDLKILLKK